MKIGHEVKAFCANEPSKSKNIFRMEVKRLNYWFKITNTNIISWLPIEILRSKYDIVHAHMPTLWISDWSFFLSKLMGGSDHEDNVVRDLIKEERNGFCCQLNEGEIAKRIMRILENNLGRKMKKVSMDLAKKYDWDKIVN